MLKVGDILIDLRTGKTEEVVEIDAKGIARTDKMHVYHASTGAGGNAHKNSPPMVRALSKLEKALK